MAKKTMKILEKIKALEIEKAKLLPLRKEEIFSVLEVCGGLTLDNKLLAGLAIYAANPENNNSNLLRELSELGKKKIPSSRNRNSVSKTDSLSIVQQDANKQEKANG
jgi:hypothetical protein